jgi:hypothetical protein
MSIRWPRICCLLIVGVAGWLPGGAGALDVHALFEQRCGQCHGHAGLFAREALRLEGGVVVGAKSGKAVSAFLPGHYGRLTADEATALTEAFLLQIRRGGLYEKKCRVCHDPAKELARRRLVVEEGVLRGRYSGRDVAAFLKTHGRLTPDEVGVLTEMLLWQLK